MKKYLFFLIFLFIAHFTFATSVTVNNYTALVTAVNGTADTIYIDGTIVTSAQITINRNVHLIGINNGTLDGNNTHRILLMNRNQTLCIDSLVLMNGYMTAGSGNTGAAICTDYNNNLIIRNSIIKNNSASIGAAIYSYYSNITITNSIIRDNYASYGGAGILVSGYSSIIQIKKSHFINNLVGGFGGAIYNYSNNVIIEDSEFIGNTADDNSFNASGGAISNQGHVRIVNSIFKQNYAITDGGAIYNSGGNIQIVNSLLSENTSNNGGAIHHWGNNINILNSTITANNSNQNSAAVTYFLNANLNVYNSIILGNISNNDISAGNWAGTFINQNNLIGKISNAVVSTETEYTTFVDFDNKNYNLLNSSPAINSGSDSLYVNLWNSFFPANAISTPYQHQDLANNTRKMACQIDMGAYELEYPLFIDNIVESICENEIFDFYGQILNSSGIYNYTTERSGCDSVLTLNLFVNQVDSTIINDTIFIENGYNQNNFSIPVQNSAGIVLDTLFLQNQNNCDSTLFLNLLVICQLKTDTINATICETETYYFKNQNLNVQGGYNDTLQTINGCDSIITLNLRVNSVYSQTQNITICDYELPYFYGDSVFNSAGTKNVVYKTIYGCDSIIVVNLTAQTSEIQRDTLVVCADLLPYTYNDTTFQIGTLSGDYQLKDMCSGVILTLNILPQSQTFLPDIPIICADSNIFVLEFQNTNEINTKPPTHYEIIFDNQALDAGFENQNGDFGNDNKIVVQLPEKIYPDYYNCKIILKDSFYNCAPQEFDIEFPVLYPDSIMKQKWDNVIALTNYYYNGGFDFAGYQWYKNGLILLGETKSYIYLGESSLIVGEKYSVLITRKDNSQMFSCEFETHEPHTKISDFPTLISPNGIIKIPQQDKNAIVRLITTTGIPLSNYQSSTNEIIAPTQQGVYFLEILSNNSRKIVKIVVK